MKRLVLIVALLLISAEVAEAQPYSRIQGFAEKGGRVIQTTPTVSYRVQESFPGCTITVYIGSTLTLATIYSDSAGTPKSNPFVADSTGFYFFHVADGTYDIKFSGIGISTPFTISGIRTPTGGAGGSGTVQSVDFNSSSSIFTVSGAPVTVVGTISLGLSTQLANRFFAGPISGGAAIPTFRQLFSSDISDATDLNTASTIIKRDTLGGFSAGDISGEDITATGSFINPTFINGSVLYTTTGGVVTEDASQFTWDSANNRLGLGTSSPVNTLDARGPDSPTISSLSTTNTPTSAGRAALTAGRVDGIGNITGWQFLKDTDDTLVFRQLTTGVATSRMLLDASGNLGVNKLSAIGAKLHTVAPSLTTKSFIAESATGTNTAINEHFQVKTLGTTAFAAGMTEGAATNANRINSYLDVNVPIMFGNDNAVDQTYTGSAYHWGLRVRDGFSGDPNLNYNKYAAGIFWKNLGNLTASTISTTDVYGVTAEAGISDTLNTFNWYQIVGSHGVGFVYGSGAVDFLQGASFNANHLGTGTIGSARGVTGFVQNLSTGTITLAHGGKFSLRSAAAGTIVTGYTIKADTPTISAGTITNLYGLYIDAQTAGTSTNFNIYSVGATTKNKFEGITQHGQGVQIEDGGTQPTCDSGNRGRIWHEYGGAGVKDSVQVCAKDAADAYTWRTIY